MEKESGHWSGSECSCSSTEPLERKVKVLSHGLGPLSKGLIWSPSNHATQKHSPDFSWMLNTFAKVQIWGVLQPAFSLGDGMISNFFFFWYAGLSLLWPLPLRSTGSGRAGSAAMAHGAQLLHGMWDLPGPGHEPASTCIGRRTLNHCATREAQ